MTPKNLVAMLVANPAIDKLCKRSKSARKAVAKARRKLAQARKAASVTEMRVLIGMAHVALAKAEYIGRSIK